MKNEVLPAEAGAHVEARGASTTLETRGAQGFGDVARRAVEGALAGVLLLVLLPLLLLVAVLIRLDSPGPVLFRQTRLGRDRRPFTVIKFRTMAHRAPTDAHRAYIARLAAGAEDGAAIKKLTADPRITRVGRVLRRTSIDELPQLVNVLLGQMALVGPRPALAYELEHYGVGHFRRFEVRPGLTGLWQVSGRSELDFDELVRLDFLYLERWSVFLDLSILLKTIPAVLRRHGAW